MTLRKMEILVNEELLKDRLTPVREICPVLLDLFIWRKDIYPCLLVGLVSSIFGFIWYYDPSVITAFSLLGLILSIGDYLVPLLSKTVSTADSWTSEKEKKFSIFVNRVTYYSVQIWNFQVTLEEWKKEYPNAYSSTIIVSLLFMAWIGSAVNNLFLTYLLGIFLILLPGMLHRRIMHVYVSRLILFISNLIGTKGKKNN